MQQDEILSFLGDPASHRPPPGRVERIDTHAACVFLAGDAAIKIKRAVRYPYLDFSTLSQRHRALQRELELNRPIAPEIYRHLIAITRGDDGCLQLGGAGEPIEWALVMRRFGADALLSRVVADGALSIVHEKALADAVFDAHGRAPISATVGQARRLQAIVDEIADALAPDAGLARAAGQFRDLASALLGRIAPLVERRAASGFVRRCHGDLHLENVVLWDDRPTLFDALEFDEELATIDTLYDLAFLLMDLEFRGGRASANRVLGRYLWRSSADLDLAGLAALPLFLALRAGIRAMVAVQRAAVQGSGGACGTQQQSAAYLEAALGYLKPPAPRLIVVGGLSGTGKSTLAAALAPLFGAAPGALHLRSDLERKAIAGVGETDRLGADAYTLEANVRVYERLYHKARLALQAGHALIVDAVFSKAEERATIEATAMQCGVPFAAVWLDAHPDALVRRVEARTSDASDATADVVRGQLDRGVDGITWARIDAGGLSETTLAAAKGVLGLKGHH